MDAVSYSSSIVTMAVSVAVCEILEGAVRRDSSSGSRGGGSRLCKQDVDSKIDMKKLCVSRSLRLSRSSSPATNHRRFCVHLQR